MITELRTVIHNLKKVQLILEDIFIKSCPSLGEELTPNRLKKIQQFCEDCAFAILSKDLSKQPPEIQKHTELILSYSQFAVEILSRISKHADDISLGTGCLKPQYSVGDLESYFRSYCECVQNLAQCSGFDFTYTICDRYLPTVFEPVMLTKILTLLLSKFIRHSGASINLRVSDLDRCFMIEIRGGEIPPENFKDMSHNIGSAGERYLEQISPLILDELKWGSKNGQSVVTLTFPKNRTEPHIVGNDSRKDRREKILLLYLCDCLPIHKLDRYSMEPALKLDWGLFQKNLIPIESISACINAMLSRTRITTQQDIYGNHSAINYLQLNELRRGKTGIRYLNSTIYNKLIGESLSAKEIEGLAGTFGLNQELLGTPILLLKLMAGYDSSKLDNYVREDNYPALVFTSLLKRNPDFQTQNENIVFCMEEFQKNQENSFCMEWFHNYVLEVNRRLLLNNIPVSQKLANNIALLRWRRGWTIEELSLKSKVSEEILLKLEAGEIYNAQCSDLDRICRAFQIDFPPLLFLNGFVLTKLWRENFLEFLYFPFTQQYLHVDKVTLRRNRTRVRLLVQYSRLLELQPHRMILDPYSAMDKMNLKTARNTLHLQDGSAMVNSQKNTVSLYFNDYRIPLTKDCSGTEIRLFVLPVTDIDFFLLATKEEKISPQTVQKQINKILWR